MIFIEGFIIGGALSHNKLHGKISMLFGKLLVPLTDRGNICTVTQQQPEFIHMCRYIRNFYLQPALSYSHTFNFLLIAHLHLFLPKHESNINENAAFKLIFVGGGKLETILYE